MKVKILCLLGVMLLWIKPETCQASPPLSLATRVDKRSMTVGDEIVFEVIATHPRDVAVTLPDEEANVAPFEIKKYRPLPRRNSGEEMVEGVGYTLTIFKTGSWHVPPVDVFYTDYRERSLPQESGGGIPGQREGLRGSMRTEPVNVFVMSVLGEAPPLEKDLPSSRFSSGVSAGGLFKQIARSLFWVGFFSLGLYGVIRFWPKPVSRLIREDPSRIAFQQFSELRKKRGTESHTPSDYDTLSKILRQYLAKQFDSLPLYLTTEEFLERMRHHPRCALFAEGVSDLLKTCDLVKFSNRAIKTEEFDAFLKIAESSVQQSAFPMRPSS